MQSAAYSIIHGKGLSNPDEDFMFVYMRATRVLHEQISNQSSGRYSDATIMAAVNLMMSHGIGFGNSLSLAAHWKGIQALVTACGGIHNVSPQVAGLILWLDYWHTLYTNKRPLYMDQNTIRAVIVLDNPPDRTYGSSFELAETIEKFPSDLVSSCLDNCRLIELHEDKVHNTSTPSRWQYFMYKRDSVCTRLAAVHYYQHCQGTKAECLSLTMNLFLLLTLRMVPWRMPVVTVCNQLKTALSCTDLAYYWDEDIDMLTWILFLVQAVSKYWDGTQWALELLEDTLRFQSGQSTDLWSSTEWELQRQNLYSFAWSKVFLDEHFEETRAKLADKDSG